MNVPVVPSGQTSVIEYPAPVWQAKGTGETSAFFEKNCNENFSRRYRNRYNSWVKFNDQLSWPCLITIPSALVADTSGAQATAVAKEDFSEIR